MKETCRSPSTKVQEKGEGVSGDAGEKCSSKERKKEHRTLKELRCTVICRRKGVSRVVGKKSEKSWHSEETFFFLFFFFFIIIIILDSVEERFTTFWKISQKKKHYYYDYYAVSERV